MGKRFSIESVFTAIDRMTNPVAKMQGRTNAFSKSVRRDFAKAQRSVERFNSSIRSKMASAVKIGATATLAALGMATGLVIREFVNFDQAIISAGAKFKDLVPGSEEAKLAMEELRMTARKVGSETQFSATEAAKGLDYLAMAGFTSKQSMALLPGVVNLATIANVDLARSTDIASDALGAFGLMTNNTAKLTMNFTRLQDVMAKTVTSTNTTMEDLFEAIKFGAPAFTIAGQSMESFNAIAGRMAANGIKATNAGTALRAGMIRLQDPPKPARKALEAMGITIADSSGKMRPIIDIMKDMETKMKSMTPIQRTSALAAIFGKNAFSAWAAVLNEGVDQTIDLHKSLLQAKGSAAAMAAEIRKSLLNRLKGLQSAAIELGFKFVDAFAKQGGNAIDKITKAIREFDPTPIITGIKFIINVISTLFRIVNLLMPVIAALTAVWLVYKGILIATAIKQAILNVVMMANPLGLMVLAVAALIGGFLILARETGGIQNAFIVLGKIILKSILQPVNLVLVSIQGLLFVLSKIPKVGDKIAPAYEAIKGFRTGMNKKLELTEFNRGEEAPAKAGPATNRTFFSKIIERTRKQALDININNNQSANQIESGGRQIPSGSSVSVPASG